MFNSKQGMATMPHVKIGPNRQVTIPKDIFQSLGLEVGDILEATIENGRVIYIPKEVIEKAPAPKLTATEQKLLKTVQKKIKAIQTDITSAKGLTNKELAVAVKARLIDPEQQYWWREEWQRGEREAQKEIAAGETEEFTSTQEFIQALNS